MKHAAIYIGTSGYSYPHWRGAFYPDSVKPADYLKFYAANFNSVEINYSYYHIPPEKTVEKWAAETPA